MISRLILNQIRESMGHYPVLALTGPRQSGKTTLLKNAFPDYRYVTLENPDSREFALRDPQGFLSEYNHRIIFDEVQNSPNLFSYMQGLVDDRQQMGQFILSGSQNFNLMERITQSLAGRVAMFRLFPFQLSEMKDASWLSDDLPEVMTKGFYPAIFERDIDQDRYYSNYVDTYVTRDVSQLINIKDSLSFRRFLQHCAVRAGQIVNLSDLARDAGISHTTAKNWLSLLETSFVLFLMPTYFKNFGKRLIKSPKLYFFDVGLLCHLLAIRKGKLSPTHSSWGAIFENMIISELIKIKEHTALHRDYYFWRDSKGNEIDLLYQENESLYAFEIKASKTVQNRMFDGLDYLQKISDMKVLKKHLVYAGDQSQKRTNYDVLSWRDLS